jgi:hypothetical protein
MTTLNTGVPARNDGYQGVQFLRKRITYLDYGTTVTIGKLPAGASILPGSGVHIVTAFNSSGTDLLDVGFIGATTDPDGYATALTLGAVGFIVLDELATTTNIQGQVEHTVTCAPTQGAADATAGAADITIMFSVPN